MIEVEKLGASGSAEYDRFVETMAFSSIYQSYDWGESKKCEGWDVVRLLARDEGRAVGSLSCLSRKIPAIGYSFYYCPRGPVVDYATENGRGVFGTLVKYMRTTLAAKRVLFLRFNPDLVWQHESEKVFLTNGFTKVQNPILHTSTLRLDLCQSEEQLLGAMEGRTRYDIRRAIKEGVQVCCDDWSEEFLKTFYRLLSDTSRRNRFPIYSYTMMKNLWDRLSSKGQCRIFLSKLGEDVLSGIFVFVFGGKCVYQWGASDNKKFKVNPNQLLHWEVIRMAKGLGCTSYDFQGIPENVSPDHPLWGIYLFKRGFGSKTVKLVGEYDLVLSKHLYPLWKILEPAYPRVKQTISRIVGE